MSGFPALSIGSEVWVAIHNHRPEPLRLHSGQNVGTLEEVAIADSQPPPAASKPLCQPPVPEHLSPIQQQQLKDLFQEFSDIISQGEDDLGCTPLLQHTIDMKGPPLRQPYRWQNPAVRREEMVQVQQMLTSGVIRPSNSPWASPVVMVKKKDGSLRFCIDFRQLNAATIKDAHPLPRIDDLLDALHGARWFSTLDCKSGYWQVPIQERDKEKTAFRTSGGQLFEFNQVPFGPRLMDRVLSGLHWETCLFYLDDIIVFAITWEEHLNRLCQVFERLRHTKLKLGAEKCIFAAKEVSYLGHCMTEEGLLPDPSLLAAIREIHPPKNATEVRSFLGLAGYYRGFVKNFAAIAGPLHALTRKDTVFHWSSECQDAFDCLKKLLTTSPITAFPDFSLPFCLYTDSSTAGLGAILAQVREGKERIICCASRSLNQVENAYLATKLERLAIVWAVAKFRPYLMSMPFEVYMDHYTLQWLKTMRTGSALLHRWSAALEEYDFTVITALGSHKRTSTASAAYPSTILLRKTLSSKYGSWRTKKKPEKLPENSTPPPTSVGRRCGSSSTTGIHTKPTAASPSKPPRVVPNVNWAVTTDIARRRPVLSSLKVRGIRCPLTLWDLCPGITARNS